MRRTIFCSHRPAQSRRSQAKADGRSDPNPERSSEHASRGYRTIELPICAAKSKQSGGITGKILSTRLDGISDITIKPPRLQQSSQTVSGDISRNAVPDSPSARRQIENCNRDEQDAPRSKFVKQMRQIKIKRLGSMNCFAKTSQKFAHDHFIKEAGLKQDAAANP